MGRHHRCPFRTCNRTFNQPGHLNRHLQVQHQDLVDAAQTVLAGAAHPPPPIGSSSGHAGQCAEGRGGKQGAGGSASPTADGTGGDADDNGGHSSGSGSNTVDEGNTNKATDSDWTGSGETLPSDSDNSASTQPLTSWDDEEDASDEMPPMDDQDENEPADVSTLFVEMMRQQTPVAFPGDTDYGATLSGRVLQWFHDLHRTAPAVSGARVLSSRALGGGPGVCWLLSARVKRQRSACALSQRTGARANGLRCAPPA